MLDSLKTPEAYQGGVAHLPQFLEAAEAIVSCSKPKENTVS